MVAAAHDDKLKMYMWDNEGDCTCKCVRHAVRLYPGVVTRKGPGSKGSGVEGHRFRPGSRTDATPRDPANPGTPRQPLDSPTSYVRRLTGPCCPLLPWCRDNRIFVMIHWWNASRVAPVCQLHYRDWRLRDDESNHWFFFGIPFDLFFVLWTRSIWRLEILCHVYGVMQWDYGGAVVRRSP